MTLAEALRNGWQVEEKLYNDDRKWVGYILRRKRDDGLWEKANFIMDPE